MTEIRSLTALRGIAAIWIVLHHFWPQTDHQTPYIIAKGYLAVDLFFILSGMVLYLVYVDEIRSGAFSVRHFARKRFARLYPVHLVTTILAAAILAGGPVIGMGGRDLPYDIWHMLVLHLGLMHAWGITETGGLNYPSWSLSAEAFAYLLFPFLCMLSLGMRKSLLLVLAVAGLILAYLAVAYFWDGQSFTRLENDFGVLRILPELFLGAALARWGSAYSGSLAIVVGVVLVASGLGLNQDLISVLGFALLLLGCLQLNPITPEPLRWLGVISYSLYMVHALVQIAGFKLIERLGGYSDSEVPLFFMIPMLLATLLCAAILYQTVEHPARRWLLRGRAAGSLSADVARSSPM